MEDFSWATSLPKLRDEFRRQAAKEKLWHAVVLLPTCRPLDASALESFVRRLVGRQRCEETLELSVRGGRQMHYFFGTKASYDEFLPVAKRGADLVEQELKVEFS